MRTRADIANDARLVLGSNVALDVLSHLQLETLLDIRDALTSTSRVPTEYVRLHKLDNDEWEYMRRWVENIVAEELPKLHHHE